MSKITNDGWTRSGTGSFSILQYSCTRMATVCVKGMLTHHGGITLGLVRRWYIWRATGPCRRVVGSLDGQCPGGRSRYSARSAGGSRWRSAVKWWPSVGDPETRYSCDAGNRSYRRWCWTSRWPTGRSWAAARRVRANSVASRHTCVDSRSTLEMITFQFLPIPTRSIPIPFHSHSQTIVQSLRHKHIWRIKDSANIQYHSTELVTESHFSHYCVMCVYTVYHDVCVKLYVAITYAKHCI